jgi:hypothetical protein
MRKIASYCEIFLFSAVASLLINLLFLFYVNLKHWAKIYIDSLEISVFLKTGVKAENINDIREKICSTSNKIKDVVVVSPKDAAEELKKNPIINETLSIVGTEALPYVIVVKTITPEVVSHLEQSISLLPEVSKVVYNPYMFWYTSHLMKLFKYFAFVLSLFVALFLLLGVCSLYISYDRIITKFNTFVLHVLFQISVCLLMLMVLYFLNRVYTVFRFKIIDTETLLYYILVYASYVFFIFPVVESFLLQKE